MSEQTIRRTERIADIQAAMPWLVAAGVYVLVWRLRRSCSAIPTATRISRSVAGSSNTLPCRPSIHFPPTFVERIWLAFEWLSEIVFTIAYMAGGWMGIVVAAAVATATAFGLLTQFLLRELRPTVALFGALVALPLTAPHILARPHILALPLIVAWVAALIRSVDTRTPPPWAILPLMTLWANLHGSFTFGLAMIGAVGA